MTQVSTNKRTALFPGTFNPFTAGHADIARRGLAIFDELIIGVGINASKPKADAEAAPSRYAAFLPANPAYA